MRQVAVCLLIAGLAAPLDAQSSAPLLPIPVGAWVEQPGQCATATTAWVFDGRRTGYVGYNPRLRPAERYYAPLEPFNAVRKAAGGFTEFRPEGFGEVGRMLVRLDAPDRLTLVVRAPSRDSIEDLPSSMRRCPFAQLSQPMQTAIQRFAPSLATGVAAQGSQVAAQPIAGQRWTAAAPASGTPIAYVAGPAAMNAIGLSCLPNGSVSVFASAAGQRIDRPLTAGFASPASDYRIDAVMRFDPRSKLFVGIASGALIELFRGSDRLVDVSIDGRASGQLSLANSTAAIGEALASCLGTQAGPAATAASAPAALGPALPPLGIVAGYYVDEGTPCTDPIEAFYYDARRAGVIFADDGAVPIPPIGKVERRGGQFYLSNSGIEVKVLGPTRVQLTIQDTEGPKRLCPAAQIPASIRRLGDRK